MTDSVANDTPEIDVREHGAAKDGEAQVLDRRLFFQLHLFDIEPGAGPRAMAAALGRRLAEKNIPSVLYEDANDHRGLALLTWSEDPAHFVTRVRPLLGGKRFGALTPRPGWSMFGRTYSTGFEADLEHHLLQRSVDAVLNPDAPWAIWYPLRRKGEFNRLPDAAKSEMLREHGKIGRAYGETGLVTDVRLACFGLDPEDNDFVIGLVGADLHPLSHVVETMRSTRQTAEYMDKLGPFFVGRKTWQNPRQPVRPAAEEPTPTPTEAPAPAEDAPAAVEPVQDDPAPPTPAAEAPAADTETTDDGS